MQTMVIYDIENDRIRSRIAEVCKDYGLGRIQKSAFLGDLDHNRREELAHRLAKTLAGWEGDIQVCPICDKDLGMRLTITVGPEEASKAREKGMTGERRKASGKGKAARGRKAGSKAEPKAGFGSGPKNSAVRGASKA